MSRRDVKTDRGLRMSIVECDRRDCNEQFRSSSDPKLVEQQLVAAKWTLLEMEVPRSMEWEKKILCPSHRPQGRSINGRAWRERSPQGQKGSRQSKYSGDLR